MRQVLDNLERRTQEFAAHPLFARMRDESLDPRERLAFVPALSHFVMTFADLYNLVLREEPPRDKYQELVNAHTEEDGGHWKWFLADLDKIGHDPRLPFSQALKFVWSDATVRTRMLSYEICRLGLGASSITKLVLVQCIEATGKVTLASVTPVGKQIATRTGKNLVYFGAHHFETESDHTLEQDDAREMVADIEIAPELSRELCAVVDKCFELFTRGADELLEFARSGRGLPS